MNTSMDGEYLRQIPTMNRPELLGLFFETLPNPKIDNLDQSTSDRLHVCGVVLTELRERAIGQRSIEQIQAVHVLADEIAQVANHLQYKAQRGGKTSGLWTPGMPQ